MKLIGNLIKINVDENEININKEVYHKKYGYGKIILEIRW